jgi:uncharacterized protein YndB with AHSA1/START domain
MGLGDQRLGVVTWNARHGYRQRDGQAEAPFLPRSDADRSGQGAVDCKASCDLRPGGAFSLVMSSGESIREVSGTYVEIDRPRKLVFTWIGPLTNNVNTLVTVELNPRGDETDLVLTHERLPTPAICEGHTRGWGNILDHLADTVSKDF